MKDQNFSTSIIMDSSPGEVFDAINRVRNWWSGAIDGETDKLGAVFTYRYKDMHLSKQMISEFVPGRKIVWKVLESDLSFVEDRNQWAGTEIVFEIDKRGDKTELRFSHRGLTPDIECYGACSSAWGSLVKVNLKNLILTGKSQPDAISAV